MKNEKRPHNEKKSPSQPAPLIVPKPLETTPAPNKIRLRATDKPVTVKPPKRDNIFSQSRDNREDRGTRAMKTSQNARTVSHGRGR